ncbi:Glutathione S-transferase, partial [Quillaja saponaria]
HKKVPVLIHKGKPISESLIILQYLDDVWKHQYQLHSHDPYNRANQGFWIDYFDKKIADCGRRMWASKGEDQEAAKKEFIECLKLLEGELDNNKRYFEGDYFWGFGHCPNTILLQVLLHMRCSAKFSIEKECPKLMEWVKRCYSRESVSKTLPDPYKVYDYVLELKKRFGIE